MGTQMEGNWNVVNTGKIRKAQDRPSPEAAGVGLKITPEEKEAKIRALMRLKGCSYEVAKTEVEKIISKAPDLQRAAQRKRMLDQQEEAA